MAVVTAGALVCSGCATGHLLDRARRWERPIAYEQAAIGDGRLVVWVYPLLPFTAAWDAVTVPVLLVFAPAVIIPGD
jgi:hypothetical protein